MKIENHVVRRQDHINEEEAKHIRPQYRLKDDLDVEYFQIHSGQSVREAYGSYMAPIRYPYYFVAMLKQGQVEINLGLSEFTAEPYALWFAPPRVIYSLLVSSDHLDAYYFTFSESFVNLYSESSQFLSTLKLFNQTHQPYLELDQAIGTGLFRRFEELHQEFQHQKLHQQQLIVTEVKSILLKTDRLFCEKYDQLPEETKMRAHLLHRFKALIETHYTQRWPIQQYAEQLNVHPNYLNRVVKKESGKTSSALLDERIILEAKSLLVQTDLSASEIAYQLNFSEPSHFYRFFKTRTGLTAQNFRKERKV